MVSFMFWNIHKKPLAKIIRSLAELHDVDVILLAESEIRTSSLLTTLNRNGHANYHFAPGNCTRIQIFTRFSEDFIKPTFETDRLTIRHLNLPGLTDILLAVTHFPSKLFWSDQSQSLECVVLANDIKRAERLLGHSRLILVGDLNMNPFEFGVAGALGLHSVMTRDIARRGSRLVKGRRYPFFYNPMWGLFGDIGPGPPGTYYYRSSEHVSYFWNIYDQVLIRPDLVRRFNTDDLAILDTDGNLSLTSDRGIPDRSIGSDHLPVYFTIDL